MWYTTQLFGLAKPFNLHKIRFHHCTRRVALGISNEFFNPVSKSNSGESVLWKNNSESYLFSVFSSGLLFPSGKHAKHSASKRIGGL